MKKSLLVVGALAIAIAAAPLFAAFEAHVINVTAHIENALRIHPEDRHLEFGTVFPQEYFDRNFTVNLSDSFMGQERVDTVEYIIKQKPKCECNETGIIDKICVEGEYAAVDYATHECPTGFSQMLDLCEFLSKLPKYQEAGDVGIPSYYIDNGPVGPSPDDACRVVTEPEHATGVLSLNDTADEWLVDLKVPPVEGYVGQDWPASCADFIVPKDSQDYGCDLWLEVTGIYKD